MSRTALRIASLMRFSSSRSPPVSMICTSARDPLIISLVRSSIGCEIEKNVDGTRRSSVTLKRLAEPVEVLAVVHSVFGRRRTRMSVLSLPTGSIATSARPVIASVVITSGNSSSVCWAIRSSRLASSRLIDGARRIVTTRSPSSMRGTKFAP
jgi:hypothetical protein